jgi:hypothetical protein
MGWKVIPPTEGSPVVTAVFEGHLSSEEGAKSAEAFRAAFDGRPLAVVWDVTKMGGFDGGARSAWAEVVWPMREQIVSLKVVGARGMVRMGATFLALLLGKPYEFASASEAERESRTA